MEVTQKQLADTLGLSTRQVHNLVEEGMPVTTRGGRKMYPVPEAVQWYVRWREEVAVRRVEPTDIEAAKARKMAAEASLAELELAKAQSQVVTLDVMERELGAALYRLRAKLIALPDKWAPTVVGMRSIPEARTRLQAAVEEAMLSLSETGEEDEGEEVAA